MIWGSFFFARHADINCDFDELVKLPNKLYKEKWEMVGKLFIFNIFFTFFYLTELFFFCEKL